MLAYYRQNKRTLLIINSMITKASYILPQDVISPQGKVSGKPHVIYDSGENSDNNEGFSIASVNYGGEDRICLRWNGSAEDPLGFPNARGYPTWDVVPRQLAPFVEYVGLQLKAGKEALVPNTLDALMKGIKALKYKVTVSI
jgi:hypothetical protein